jgi:hypothetical protein
MQFKFKKDIIRLRHNPLENLLNLIQEDVVFEYNEIKALKLC